MAPSSDTADRAAGERSKDRAFCVEILPHVSRTFALSIAALPEPLRGAVEAAYLLCRVVDSIEDDATLAVDRRDALFDVFDRALAGQDGAVAELEAEAGRWLVGVAESEQMLCRNAGAVFRAYAALPAAHRAVIGPRVATMSRGMREHAVALGDHSALDASQPVQPFAGLAELEDYCYYVAGTVGELLTDLFADVAAIDSATHEAVAARAVCFGTGLQLVNIIKDVAADLARGVCFVPRALLDAEALAPSDLLEPACRPAALRIVEVLAERAREHLGRAAEYTMLWPASAEAARGFCAAPLALALATLAEVIRGEDTLAPGRTPKVARPEAMRIFIASREAACDDEALSRLLAELGG